MQSFQVSPETEFPLATERTQVTGVQLGNAAIERQMRSQRVDVLVRFVALVALEAFCGKN